VQNGRKGLVCTSIKAFYTNSAWFDKPEIEIVQVERLDIGGNVCLFSLYFVVSTRIPKQSIATRIMGSISTTVDWEGVLGQKILQ
jgi:hypothetical protein